jgi:hypothetical protein
MDSSNWHEGSLNTARGRKRGASCDPLEGRLGFRDRGLAELTLELSNRANEDSYGRKRHKRPRAAPADQHLLRT